MNPYSPPSAALADQPRPPGSPAKAVLIGLAIDVGGSLLVGIVLGVVYGISLAASGMNAPEINAALSNLPPYSWVTIVGTVAGATFSVLGGFVCARVARRSDYRLGFILGGISAISGLLVSYSGHSFAVNMLLTCLTFASVLLGTKFGRVTE